ncbi:hypothetical protein ACSBR2_030495 [Camellia fascicularis]
MPIAGGERRRRTVEERAGEERSANAEERERQDGEGEEAKMPIAGGERRRRTVEERDGGGKIWKWVSKPPF